MFTPEFIQSSFYSDEPVKDIALRLGFDYPLLSSAWKQEFGEFAFKARINRLKGLASKRSHSSGSRKKEVLRETPVPCSVCGDFVQVKLVAACQLDRSKFTCKKCSGDRDCPVCGKRVNGGRGLAQHFSWHRKCLDQEHLAYKDKNPFEGKIEGEDYVVCLECGAKETTLGTHLVRHQMNMDSYRQKHGVDTPIHSAETLRRKSLAARSRADYGKGMQKSVACPDCGGSWIGSKFLVPGTHDLRCVSCKKTASEEEQIKEDLKWSLLKEPEDYVTCLDCGYRSESLISHLQNAHSDYRVRHPESEVVSLNSRIRDKALLRGRTLSEDVRKRMSENAGRWAAGLTKEKDERIARAALKMRGRVPWSRGLSKETDPRLETAGQTQRAFHKRRGPVVSKKRIDVALSILGTFLDSEGNLEYKRASESLKLSEHIIVSNARRYGLDLKSYEDPKLVRLNSEELTPFQLKNKISVVRASLVLGHSCGVIRRECHRNNLPVFNNNQSQELCLEVISTVLQQPYTLEWSSRLFCDALTGHRYRFDGFFKELGLVVEFQGYQHYTFPNRYHKTLEEHEECLRRDVAKRAMIEGTPGLIFFEVRDDEPFTDESYMRGRLHQAGFVA